MSKLLQTSWTYTFNSMEQMPNWPFWIINLSLVILGLVTETFQCWEISTSPCPNVDSCVLRFLKDVSLRLSATETLPYKPHSDCFTQSLDPQRSLGSLAVAGMGKMIQPSAPIRWLRVQLDHFLSVCACVCQTSHSVQWTGKQAEQMTPYFRLQFIPRQGAAGKMELSGR